MEPSLVEGASGRWRIKRGCPAGKEGRSPCATLSAKRSPGLCVAVAACAASALEAPAYGPGAGGVVYLLLPPLALQMLIFCAASLIARQWLRAAAFAVALAACVLCFRCLYGLTCP